VVEIGRMAIAGEKNIEAGKGISGLGCYGAGGGTWAMPYAEECLAYGNMEADQIKATGHLITDNLCYSINVPDSSDYGQ